MIRMREFSITGYVVGTIWMPAAECYKFVDYHFVRDEADKSSPWVDVHDNLRDAMLHITNDGDFQSCALADGLLTVTDKFFDQANGMIAPRRTHSRSWAVANFPSVADMVKFDWEGPQDDDNG